MDWSSSPRAGVQADAHIPAHKTAVTNLTKLDTSALSKILESGKYAGDRIARAEAP